jgi:hypothetical protein
MSPRTAPTTAPPAAPIAAERRERIAHLIAINVPDHVVASMLAHEGLAPGAAERAIRRGHADVRFARRVLGGERYRLAWLFGIDARLAAMTRPRGAIERVPYRSVRDVRRYYAANQPAIFTGMCARWNALGWTPRHFADRYGEERVEVETRHGHLPDLFAGAGVENERVRMADFVAAIEAGHAPAGYLVSKNGLMQDARFGALFDDLVPLPKVLDPERLRESTHLWFGGPGTVTELHHDGSNILFAQLHGRKRFRMAPPYALFDLYPSAGVWSANRACATDDPAFPASRNAEVCEFVLEPGEAVLIPVGWWHHVTALDASISVSFTNFYWPNYFGSPRERGSWPRMPTPPESR